MRINDPVFETEPTTDLTIRRNDITFKNRRISTHISRAGTCVATNDLRRCQREINSVPVYLSSDKSSWLWRRIGLSDYQKVAM
jgi:hypothetical protein